MAGLFTRLSCRLSSVSKESSQRQLLRFCYVADHQLYIDIQIYKKKHNSRTNSSSSLDKPESWVMVQPQRASDKHSPPPHTNHRQPDVMEAVGY